MNELFYRWGITVRPHQVRRMWNAPGRFYHSETHLDDLLYQISTVQKQPDRDKLTIAAIFHDIIYDPVATDNEERCALFLEAHCTRDVSDIVQIIRDTSTHVPSTELSAIFNAMDMDILNRIWPELQAWEDGIYLEYNPHVGSTYKEKRLAFLSLYANPDHPNFENLQKLLFYVEHSS
jgi:predicted metal-dependent HD superfamily phosphohydrolase